MIANYRREAMVLNEKVQRFAILWPFRNQVSDGNDSIVRLEINDVEQIRQLIIATVDVANYDRARHGFRGQYRNDSSRIDCSPPSQLIPSLSLQVPTLVKQMMYRVDIPVREIRRNNLRSSGAESCFRNRRGHADR